MADELSMALLELLRKADAEDRVDFVRTAVERLAQQVMDVETEQPQREPPAGVGYDGRDGALAGAEDGLIGLDRGLGSG